MKTKTPKAARSARAIMALPREDSSTTTGGAWALVDEHHITLVKQRLGEAPRGMVTLTRGEFEQLVRWYETGSIRKRVRR